MRVEVDTDEGEAEYNSTVTPGVKTYTGFDSPSQGSISIKHEEVYPPVLNKVDYNYDRHQHTLTIVPNGGIYTEQTTSTMYYEASITLTPPTKTGYNFTNWTASTGTINGNDFTMGDEDSTVTANYEAKTFSVTFNPNGGETPTASKTVTYDSTYGELPTPTYEGFEFLGWFTNQEDGTQVLSTTKVALSDNQTLYAQWKKKGEPAKPILLGKANALNITNYNLGNKQEIFVFDHPETDQTKGWTEEERRDYRYIGNEPNNYITFNDETWRIIGVFTVETESGERIPLMKIIRHQSIGNLAWDSNKVNEWSTASLQKLLNVDYYSQTGSYTSTASVKGLSTTARSQIAKVKWYLGGSSIGSNLGGPDYYNFERGVAVYSGRTANIIANIGLMYSSDYVYTYANGVDNTCYTDGVDNTCYTDGYNCKTSSEGTPSTGWLYASSVVQWTVSPIATNASRAFLVRSIGYMNSNASVDETNEVRPVVFLDSKIAIIDGDGSQENPYKIN